MVEIAFKLYLLDNYVHNNGEPTWWANRIREKKLMRKQGKSQKHCMAHWEVLWRNFSIVERKPAEKTEFHFNDWGVTTVRRKDSFLALKGTVSHNKLKKVAVEVVFFKCGFF